jgi:hypothetical protein
LRFSDGSVHQDQKVGAYFSEVLIEVNWVFRVVPRPLTTAMIARAMPAAISPYSMAVAPVCTENPIGLMT